ncbi:nuclear transport factor 2 family protein [Bradyrhizobium sp. USDA 4509]
MTLEERVQRIEDDKAIRELLARYGFNIDVGRIEAFVDLFTKDGVLNKSYPADDFRPESVVRCEGRDALRASMREWKALEQVDGPALHFMGNNLRTQIDGDNAIAEGYNFTVSRRGAEMVIDYVAINRWTLRRTDGQWRIVECIRKRPNTEGYLTLWQRTRTPQTGLKCLGWTTSSPARRAGR